jgi:hypothetical protein
MYYCKRCKTRVAPGHFNERSHRRNVCRICKFANYDQYEFTRHLNTHGRVKSITFPLCNKCNVKKPKSEHFQTRSYNQNICLECGYETYDENEFRYHKYTHSIDLMDIECTRCEYITDDEQEFYDHLKCHKIYTINDFVEDDVIQCMQYWKDEYC